MKKIFSTLLILSGLYATGHSAVYIANYDTEPYTFGANMDGLNGWVLDGSSEPDVAFIRTSPFPSPPSSGGRAVYFGFNPIDPGETSAYLYRSPGSSLVGNALGYTEFQASLMVVDSSPNFPNRDSFGLTFRSATDQNLLTININPTAQTSSPDLNTRTDIFSWDSDFAAGSSNVGTLNEGQWTSLNVLFTPSGVNDVDFTIKSVNNVIATGTLAGQGGAEIGTWGFEWNPLDPDDVGDNILIFDDVVFIPEPSSAMLLMLAGLGILSRRKRA